MPNRAVAMHAIELFLARAGSHHVVHEIRMAMEAILLQDSAAHVANLDWLVKVLQREALGMPEAVFGLGVVLADKIVRQVAIDALSHVVMAGFLPAVKFRLHDVAIDARLGVRT